MIGLGWSPIAGAVSFTDADNLLANSSWPNIGNGYRHQGRGEAGVVGPTTPATRWWTRITRQPGLKDENGFMRSVVIGKDNQYLYVGAGMPGVYRLDRATGALAAPSLFSVRAAPLCHDGETWVEDVTVGADNTLYFVNEGGCLWAVDGNTMTMKWQRKHGFLHAPPALYPHPTFGTIIFIISPDGLVKGIDTNGNLRLQYRYTVGSGNKESVREKGFTWDSTGTLYFAVLGKLFMIDPMDYTCNPANVCTMLNKKVNPSDPSPTAPRRLPLNLTGVSAGPVISQDGQELYFSGEGTFLKVNPIARTVASYALGSSTFDRSLGNRTGKERWPAVSHDGNTVFFSSSNGLLYAMNRATWTVRCVHRIDGPGGYFAGIKSDPIIDAAGTVYVYAADQNIYAVNPGDCSRKWKSGDFGATSGIRDTFYFGTNLALGPDGTLYVATTGTGTNNLSMSAVWAVGNAD
jgi:outer membrane protein assembly factor BamB